MSWSRVDRTLWGCITLFQLKAHNKVMCKCRDRFVGLACVAGDNMQSESMVAARTHALPDPTRGVGRGSV